MNTMPTPTEIKRLAEEYAELTDGSPADKAYIRVITQCFAEWLSKTYCIVPKSKIKEIYDCYKQHKQVTSKKGLHEAMLIARGSISAMHDIFGKSLFNKE